MSNGEYWWTNGNESVKSIECPGEGWERGLYMGNKTWWTNGTENKKSVECPGEGWFPGMHPLKHERKPPTNRNNEKIKRHYSISKENSHKIKSVMKFWNNGVSYMHSKVCPGEGWVNGFIKTDKNS